MRFFGALDTPDTLPNRSLLDARVDDRSSRSARTIGQFAVYMHDFGLDKFDARFRDDAACWNGTAAACVAAASADRNYTWWCNRRPNNPCVYGCPNQVDECYHPTSPGARSVRYDGASPLDPLLSAPLARWANGSSRGWPSAWLLSGNNAQSNTVHVQGYQFGDGWQTSLVTNVSASTGQGLDYWSQGRLRVTYGDAAVPTAAATPSSFSLPPGNGTGASATSVYWMGLDGAPTFWASRSIATTHRVYGGFTVAVTHESRAFQTTAECYVNNATWAAGGGGFSNATCQAAGSYSMTTCPFTFRCFTPEANAGAPGPRCMPVFPADYGAAPVATPAPAWVRVCSEYCPGCPTCPMLRCWRTAPVDTPDSAYTNPSAPYDDTKLQDDRVPYIRVRHYDDGLAPRDLQTGTDETALAWHPNSWRLSTCGSHMAGGVTTTGLDMRGTASAAGPYMSAMSSASANRKTLNATKVCALIPKLSHTNGAYADAYTLPATFPHPPFLKLTDTLVWLTELEELSFTDLAVVDFREWRTVAELASVTSAHAYRSLRATAGDPSPPQSLNDFAGACGRLEASGTLASYDMTRAQCDARAAAFGASIKTLRFNMTASQVPPMSGAFHDEDWGDMATLPELSTFSYRDRVNYWHSAVLGTLPREWAAFFPNIERIDLGVAARALVNSHRARRDGLRGTVPSSWGNMTKLVYLNLHQQLGMCAWSDEDTPFDVHLMAMRDNRLWSLNLTASMDWNETPQDPGYKVVYRSAFSQKPSVWLSSVPGGWNPDAAAGAVIPSDSLGRRAVQVMVPYNMTRRPFACLAGGPGGGVSDQPEIQTHPFTRLPEEMMLWPAYTEENCLMTSEVNATLPYKVSNCKAFGSDFANNACTPCGGLHYNHGVFVDYRDRRTDWDANTARMWSTAAGAAASAAASGSPYGPWPQSLPPFDAPCARMWARYFANDTAHVTWFTNRHQVHQAPFMADCIAKATQWQASMRAIRIVRNLTKPLINIAHATSEAEMSGTLAASNWFFPTGTGASQAYSTADVVTPLQTPNVTSPETTWPSQLYGTLPAEWGRTDPATGRVTFGNVMLM